MGELKKKINAAGNLPGRFPHPLVMKQATTTRTDPLPSHMRQQMKMAYHFEQTAYHQLQLHHLQASPVEPPPVYVRRFMPSPPPSMSPNDCYTHEGQMRKENMRDEVMEKKFSQGKRGRDMIGEMNAELR